MRKTILLGFAALALLLFGCSSIDRNGVTDDGSGNTTLLSDGSYCTSNGECQSGACQPLTEYSSSTICAYRSGSSCSLDSQCASGTCSSYYCE